MPEVEGDQSNTNIAAAIVANHSNGNAGANSSWNSYHDKYIGEIKRLREHLVQLDEEIGEASRESEARIVQLEQALSDRELYIAQLQEELQNDDEDDLCEHLRAENVKLKELIAQQETALGEMNEKNNNLQSALSMLQANLQNEIAMEMVEARKKIVYLEERLAQTSLKLQKMESRERTSLTDDALLSKLGKDLDARNYLIDQLNEEVNYLRGQMAKLIKGETGEGREGVVEKGYMRSLLLMLANPPAKVSRSEIWTLIGKALGLSADELGQIGLRSLPSWSTGEEASAKTRGGAMTIHQDTMLGFQYDKVHKTPSSWNMR